MKNYKERYGNIPNSSYPTAVSVLRGKNIDGQNPQRIVFLDLEEQSFDKKGQLLDGWRNPFQVVIQFQADQIIIKSLGKNGRDDGGNEDDYVITNMHNDG